VLVTCMRWIALVSLGLLHCTQPVAAVPLHLVPSTACPPTARVYIDEQLVGPLAFVAARGVRLPEGKHRITVEHPGHFPWDELVTAGREPLQLGVSLRPLPD
jgi:hypothetical protein